MSNIDAALGHFEQYKTKQRDTWHNDFFAKMQNQAFNEPAMSWSEGANSLSYEPTEAVGTMSSSWNMYANAAKSRGIIPDYQRFMETYNTVRQSKGIQILNSMSQLYGIHGDKSDFNLALENTIRDNPGFRDDLMRAVRLNPDNPNAAMAQMSIKNAAGDFWDRAGGRAYKGVTDWVPGMGMEGTVSAGARLAASGPFAAAAKAAAKDPRWYTGAMGRARALMPGASTAAHIRGMKGTGPLADYYKGMKGGKSWAKSSMSKVNYYKQFGGGKKALPKVLKDLGVFTDIQGKPTTAGGKPINWRSMKDKRAYLEKFNSQMDNAMSKLKKGGVAKKHYKELVDYKSKVNKLLSQKSIKKDAVKSLAKTVSKGSGNVVKKAIAKVGWSGLLKQAWKQSPKLAGKLAFSGVLKAGTPYTAGLSGLVSVGMDAWMAYDLIKLATKIIGEESGKTTFQTGALEKEENIAGY